MLQVDSICKQYVTGELVQTALDQVTLSFRDSEFVAVLGPSGSGKTTLLNIIGGLDRYDSGDLIINGISTKRYKDRDWDAYRNHTIGFVFQSYNLIPHQSILANVELALTLSGIKKAERKRRAQEALDKVGLGEQSHKKPNQLSGGQMQRVAIARALVNDPDILLADEPTGALDSETSVQVMDLLKEVAKDRLVVMVTHNPELAEQYSTRIVRLKDGRVVDDSNPFEPEKPQQEPEHKRLPRTSMSFWTSLSLSFNNLWTKKGRTILTSFAGSIGIIGIAMILSISTGVNNYINDIQRDAMTSYPIRIDASALDLTQLIQSATDLGATEEAEHEKDAVYADNTSLESFSTVTTSVTQNNLTKFKTYLDDPKCELRKYVGRNGIVYSYDTKFSAFSYDENGTLVNFDGSTVNEGLGAMFETSTMYNDETMAGLSLTGNMSTNNLSELMPGAEGGLISVAIKDNYDLIYGRYPERYDEVVLVTDRNQEIQSPILYQIGLMPASEYKDIIRKIMNGDKVDFKDRKWSYEDICQKEIYLLPVCDSYMKSENGTYTKAASTDDYKLLLGSAVKLKITGIIRLNDEAQTALIRTPIGYTRALTDYLIEHTNESELVQAQKDSPKTNVLTGMAFSPSDDEQKLRDVKKYFADMKISDKAAMIKSFLASAPGGADEMTEKLTSLGEKELAAMLDQYIEKAGNAMLISMYDNYISTGSYDENLKAFGVVDIASPSSISLYTDSFENKDQISRCIEEYNEGVEEKDKITYTDYVGLLMSSVTTIVNLISYVLIAFVAVSLVVSSIMIGIITYISVLERTKEIGILRAIGASKRNVSQVFNAETFIIGLCAGVLGIGTTLLLLIPGNLIIHAVAESDAVNAVLPVGGAIILIGLSVVLTLIGGLIPSKQAAKQDPVKALRSE